MSKTIASPSRKTKRLNRPAPELMPMIRSAFERLNTMLEICDYHVEQLAPKSKAGDEKAGRELRGLFRTMLRLQKEVDRYGTMLYPSSHEEVPSVKLQDAKPHQQTVNESGSPSSLTGLSAPILAQTLHESSFEPTGFGTAQPKKKFSETFFKRPVKTQSPAL